MIVLGCIEFLLKGCAGWMIVIWLRVLLIIHYLIWEILVEVIVDVHVRGVKIEKLLNPDIVTIHLLQKAFMEKCLCWFTHGEPYVPYNTMVEMTVWSTTNSSNVHEVIDDNSNRYRSMVMNKIKMN
jgi:hypothetical protein